MVQMAVLSAFADEDGRFGNPVGVIVDEKRVLSDDTRQSIATESGFSEIVFINDRSSGAISIYTPQEEISFAGHAVVGTVWFLRNRLQMEVTQLNGREGPIESWSEGDLTWVRSELQSTPPWWHEFVPDVRTLEELTGPQDPSQVHTQLWSWLDVDAGVIRSRTFAQGWGIPEDEANGSGCMRLAAAIGRPLKIIHGKGSVIFARPSHPGSAEVGGRVVVRDDIDIDA